MADETKPVTQKVDLDTSAAEQKVAALRASWAALKAEMSGVSIGGANGGAAPGFGGGGGAAPSVNASGGVGGTYTPPPTNAAGNGASNTNGRTLMARDPATGEMVPIQLTGGGKGGALGAVPINGGGNGGGPPTGTPPVSGSDIPSSWGRPAPGMGRINKDGIPSWDTYTGGINPEWDRPAPGMGRINTDKIPSWDEYTRSPDEVTPDVPFVPGGGGRGGGGRMGAIGRYMMAREAISIASNSANILLQNQAAGRTTQGYDFMPMAMGGLGMALGIPFGPMGMAIGGAALGAAGDAYRQFRLNQDREKFSLAGLALSSGNGLSDMVGTMAGLGAPQIAGAGAMSMAMARGMGKNAGNFGLSFARDIFNADPTADHSLSVEQMNAIAGSGNAQTMAAWARPYDRGIAARLAIDNPLAAATYITQKGGHDNALDLSRLGGDVETAGFTAQGGLSRADAAGANVRAVTMRGASAAGISAAAGIQVDTLSAAAVQLQGLIDAAKRLGDTSEEGKAKIEGYRSQLAGVNAQIAEVQHSIAVVQSQERRDIAATGIAGAASSLHITAGGSGAGPGMFLGSIAATKADLAAAQRDVNNADLTPFERRAAQRDVYADKATLFDLRRGRYDYGSAVSEARAGSAAEISGSLAELGVLGAGSGGAVSDLLGRSAAARQREADAAWSRLASMRSAPQFYTPQQLDAQKAKATGLDLEAARARIASAAPSFSAGESARLAGLDADTAAALRNLGSGGAAGYLTEQTGVVSSHLAGLPMALERGLLSAKTPGEADAMRYANQEAGARDRARLLQLTAARDTFAMSPELGGEVDQARYGYRLAGISPFLGGSPLGAITNLMSANDKVLGQMRRELADPSLDAAGRRSRMSQIHDLDLEQAGLLNERSVGWEGRLAQMTIGMPSGTPGSYRGTYRDALRFGNGNRVFGAASFADAARNREGLGFLSDSDTRPHDATSQGMATVRIIVQTDTGRYLGERTVEPGRRRSVETDPLRVQVEGR